MNLKLIRLDGIVTTKLHKNLYNDLVEILDDKLKFYLNRSLFVDLFVQTKINLLNLIRNQIQIELNNK